MADVSKIKIKGTTYNLKDTTARSSISSLPKYMNFKGTLGTGGTITSLPAASSAVVGHVYSVITAGTYAGIVTKKGDMLVCSPKPEWVILPAGEKGDKGATGAKGETGERGPQGPTGPKGTDGVTPTIKAANGANINVVGTPSVTANTVGTTTTFTFNNLKGATGAKGETGERGPIGPKGTDGVTPTIKAAAGTNIGAVGTPSVTAATSGTTTTFTFNNLKGATGAQGPQGQTGPKGTDGVTPTIKAAAGTNIGAVGTPSVTANTSGTTTTFTFNNLKGATGAQGPQGPIGVTPTIKAANGTHINATGTPSVTAATSGNTTTFTFDYLKGARGPKGDKGDTGPQGPKGDKGESNKSEVDALGKRIDNLILSSGTESSAEVIDARTGYDGTAYNTLGTAIRSQVSELKSDLAKETKNLADIRNTKIGVAWNNASNKDRARLYITVTPNTEYTISFKSGIVDGVYWIEKASESDSTVIYMVEVQNGSTITTKENTNVLCIGFNKTDVSMSDIELLLLQVEKGIVATTYINPYTACDTYLRDYAITHVTPEMFGAYGDGQHDDTIAFQKAIDTGKNVIANGIYKTTSPLIINSVLGKGLKLEFNEIIYTGSSYALQVYGRNGRIVGNYLNCDNGHGINIGSLGLTYQYNIDISMIRCPNGRCYSLGGNEPVSECIINGNRCQYGSVGVLFNLDNYWVGQNTFMNMTFSTENETGGYAFFADGSKNQLTGLTLYNVSLEGSHGGFEFVNTQATNPNETLNCFGLRTSEMSVRDGYNVLRITGSGVLRGKIICDTANLSSFDCSGATNMGECFTVEGRIKVGDIDYGMAIGNVNKMSVIKLSNLIESN